MLVIRGIPDTADAQEPTATISKVPTSVPTVKTNKDWTPVTQIVNGVEMVLVPPGCLMMGSEDGLDDEKPIHEICFEKLFWIDKTEVTNEQFAKFGGKAKRTSFEKEAKYPRERITWLEAREFCTLRGARLPTEAEWEYAARGPDTLVYPWGNDFVADNIVYRDNAKRRTAPVGSKPGGKSWVGALDMGGNVSEWVSSLHRPYPYRADDGREAETTSSRDRRRVLRGGSRAGIDLHTRTTVRSGNVPDRENGNDGFRCALAQVS